MKKLIIAIILSLTLIPPVTLADEPTDTDLAAADADAEKAEADTETEFDAASAEQCNFEEIGDNVRCPTKTQRDSCQYTVLEESIMSEGAENSGGASASAPADCNKGDNFVIQCKRKIEIKNCAASGEPAKIKSSTNYVQKNQCTPKGRKGSNERIICEDVTMLLTPLATGGAGLLNLYIGLIYRWAAGIVGIIAVLIIVINAVIIIISQGEQGKIDEAKKRIYQSLGGIAILFLSSLILYAINPDFFKL